MADSIVIQGQPTGSEAPKPETPPAGERPAWLPEKFKNPEDLATAYAELERKQSAPKPEGEAPKPPETPPTTPPAGLDFDALGKEWVESGGKLSEASKKALSDKGIPESAVAGHVEGAKAKANALVQEITSLAGNPANLAAIYEWAKANMTPAEIAAYDATVSTGDTEAVKLAFGGLQAKYIAANGQDPALLGGEGSPTMAGVKPFASKAQVVAAMRDPRYKNDPAYRAEVEARVAKTDMFGA